MPHSEQESVEAAFLISILEIAVAGAKHGGWHSSESLLGNDPHVRLDDRAPGHASGRHYKWTRFDAGWESTSCRLGGIFLRKRAKDRPRNLLEQWPSADDAPHQTCGPHKTDQGNYIDWPAAMQLPAPFLNGTTALKSTLAEIFFTSQEAWAGWGRGVSDIARN
jgi:hypothetical protein